MPIDDVHINTIIGRDSVVTGAVKIDGIGHINGDIDGSLEVSGSVFIHEDARIRADIKAKDATIGGLVEGDVIAPEGVTILSTGMVVGDIVTKRLVIEDGVIVHGTCSALNDQERFEKELEQYYTRKTIAQSW